MQAQGSPDIVVVGGGIVGTSIAYALAQRKVGRVTLLERSTLGSGMTGRSVASMETVSLFPSVAKIQQRSIETYMHFADAVGGDCGFVSLPMALLVDEKHLSGMRYALEVGRQVGAKVSEITPDAFAAEAPGVNLDGVSSVYTSTEAGYADPWLAMTSFADAARALGVEIRQNTPVLSLAVDHGRVAGVETPNGRIAASTVVLAPGNWFQPLLAPLGLSLPITLLRHFVAFLDMPDTMPHHSILDVALAFYSRPERAGNQYLFGQTMVGDGFADVGSPDEGDPAHLQDIMIPTWERVVQRFPMLEEAGFHSAYTGIADLSADGQPILGALPVDGLYIAAGVLNGFKSAPGIGQALAGLIAGDAEAAEWIAPLRPTRFEEGQPLTAPESFTLFG
jgi:glycine/D-amino acid oxidase-like deaminating enzyme